MKNFYHVCWKPSLALLALLLVSCAEPKTIDGKTYQTYGLLNSDEFKSDSIAYKPSVGSVIVGVIFFETIIAPIYIFGFDLYEPIAKKSAVK